MMKKILIIAAMLFCLQAQAQDPWTQKVGRGNETFLDSLRGYMKIMKDLHLMQQFYMHGLSVDSTKPLFVGAGKKVYQGVVSGSGSADTTIIATKAYVNNTVTDTAATLRALMVSLFSGYYNKTEIDGFFANYYNKTQSDARYLQSYTETDPVFAASDAAGIDATDISNWNAAHSHISNTANPHSVTKTQVGLGNVPNTDATNPANIVQTSSYRFVSDAEKSTWNGKQDALGFTPENVANKATSFGVINNTLYPTTQACSTYIAGLGYITGNQIITLSGDASGSGTTAITVTVDKLNGQLPSYYLNRTNHTGTQTASTVSDFTAAAKAAAVQDAITNGVTDVAPSQNAVFDALALKLNISDTLIMLSPYFRTVDFNSYWDARLAVKTSDDLTEGVTNLYFTNARARLAISLTTTGNSGAATYNSTTGVMNIPQYTLAGLGGVGGSGTTNYLAKFTAGGTIGNSTIQDDGSNIGLGGAPNASYKTYNNGSFFNNGILYLLGGGSGGIRSTNSIYIDALNAGGASHYFRYGNNIDKTFELTRALSYINGLFQTQGGFSVRGNVVTTGTTGLALHIGSTTTYTELRSYNETNTTYSPIYVNAPALLVNTSTDDGSGREIQNNGQINSTDTIRTGTVMQEAGLPSVMLKTTSNGTHAAAVAGTDYLTRSTDTIIYAFTVSDMTTALTTGTSKGYFRMPHAATLVKVKASVITASSSGTPTFDINEGGTSVLGTKLTIDANETTSETAASAATITDSALANDSIITGDIDVAGTGTLAAIIYLYVLKI